VALGAQHIQLGDAAIVIAGGQENMSLSPHVAHLRAGTKMGDMKFIDSMIKDGLWDAFNGYHMGQTAENVAQQWQISRDEQDAFAVASQNKAEVAQKAGKFADEIVPFTSSRPARATSWWIRTNTSATAPRSSDGQAAPGLHQGRLGHRRQCQRASTTARRRVLLMSAAEAARRGLTPLARIASYATAGLDPAIMGVGPIHASRKALQKAGWKPADLDLSRRTRPFAAQACAVNKDMGWDPDVVNVNGGAIAIGHPIGASGARILNTLLFEMQRRGAKKGLATLCIGGGMGVAMCLER
jgi:acetyl-CoA C-acetyltransferase